MSYYNQDFPDQSGFPGGLSSGIADSIKSVPERVNCYEIRYFIPLYGVKIPIMSANMPNPMLMLWPVAARIGDFGLTLRLGQ